MEIKKTPETDAEAITPSGFEGDEVPAEFARRLERERDEAREHLSAVKHFLSKYIAERDDARKDSEYYQERYEQLKDERDKGAEMCGQYKQERDEAREQEQIHHDNYITMKKKRDEWSAMCGQYKQERDEAWDRHRRITVTQQGKYEGFFALDVTRLQDL